LIGVVETTISNFNRDLPELVRLAHLEEISIRKFYSLDLEVAKFIVGLSSGSSTLKKIDIPELNVNPIFLEGLRNNWTLQILKTAVSSMCESIVLRNQNLAFYNAQVLTLVSQWCHHPNLGNIFLSYLSFPILPHPELKCPSFPVQSSHDSHDTGFFNQFTACAQKYSSLKRRTLKKRVRNSEAEALMKRKLTHLANMARLRDQQNPIKMEQQKQQKTQEDNDALLAQVLSKPPTPPPDKNQMSIMEGLTRYVNRRKQQRDLFRDWTKPNPFDLALNLALNNPLPPLLTPSNPHEEEEIVQEQEWALTYLKETANRSDLNQLDVDDARLFTS
jgi:hypothetical protein